MGTTPDFPPTSPPSVRRTSRPRSERETASVHSVRDAALTLFARRGFHGTALSEIAEALQIRTPSLYNHMTSKQGLLAEIVTTTSHQVWEDYRHAVAEQSTIEGQIRAAVYVYALRHATHPREAMVVNRDIAALEEPTLSEVLELRRRHEHALRGLVEQGIDDGIFDRQPASLVSFAVLEMCVSIARWYRPDGEFAPEEIARQYGEFALRMARGDRTTSGPSGL
jgi:AcrR family transcriptional regulator